MIIKTKNFVEHNLLKKIIKRNLLIVLLTWSRSSNILPSFLDHVIHINNGKKHFPIRITKSFFPNINKLKTFHKLGEFSFTRHFMSHKVIDRKIQKKKK